MSAQQTAADLRAAAEVLKRDGWTQGLLHRGDGCHCAMGALTVATGYHYDVQKTAPSEMAVWVRDDRQFRRFVDAEDTLMASIESGVPKWNDELGRTADEVIAALEAAAAAAEADL